MKTFNPPVQLETPRLMLRQWQVRDFEAFADLNADPDVMRYFPATLSKNESDLLAHRFQDSITEYGWGFWVVELKENQQFIGFVGLANQAERYAFSPCVEIGWRFAQQYWHQGYATEAAQQCLAFAFEKLALEQVVSFTSILNQASEKVMQRLGMDYVENFMHPALDKNHALAEHVLYRIQNPKL